MSDSTAPNNAEAPVDETVSLRPLSPKSDGVVPYRYDDVTQQIRNVLSGGERLLIMHATARDSPAARRHLSHLKEESLVYLIRAFRFEGRGSDEKREEIVEGLCRELSLRCSPSIHSFMRPEKSGITRNQANWDVNDAYDKAHSRVFELVFTPGNTVSDYLEVNFWKALTRIKQKVRADLLKNYAEQQIMVSLSASAGAETTDADEGNRTWQEILLSSQPTPEEVVLFKEEWMAAQRLLFSIVNPQHREYGGPFCQDTREGHFKVETSPFSRRLAGLCESSLACRVAAGAT